ncbi:MULTISPECIES: hypothetical protein [unclassified Moorena]|uniref:hypothetical protein n=1 Tax=unclassified Moorena TaxID=2683338 RepID=UPI0013CCB17F|nr:MULTISPECIES: hypothetical protein [unclassified Moorena]NEO25094.1 hypothetical protein [Moorena sp. SIO4A5]NEP26366.1 hypothetical protein [Moorena sp. SIO3I6]
MTLVVGFREQVSICATRTLREQLSAFSSQLFNIAYYSLVRYKHFFSYSLFPIPYSLFPIPCSLFPAPCSLLPAP